MGDQARFSITRGRARRHRRGGRIVAAIGLGVAFLLPLVPASPAVADDAMESSLVDAGATRHGYAAFEGSAALPQFPCPVSPLAGGCGGGTFRGAWQGRASGMHGPAPYDVTWHTLPTNPPTISAGFSYWENCVLPHLGAVSGGATGTGVATASGADATGTYWVLPWDLPRAVLGVRLSFDFIWTRAGTNAVITLTRATLSLTVSGLSPDPVVLDGRQFGGATFVVQSGGSPGLPTCDTSLSNVTGTIAGAMSLIDD